MDDFGFDDKVLNTNDRPLFKNIVRTWHVSMMYKGPYVILEKG